MLCIQYGYSPFNTDSEYVAILLVVSGLPNKPGMATSGDVLGNGKPIMGYGPACMGLLLSLVALVIGAVSLFVHSQDYHRRHPEVKAGWR